MQLELNHPLYRVLVDSFIANVRQILPPLQGITNTEGGPPYSVRIKCDNYVPKLDFNYEDGIIMVTHYDICQPSPIVELVLSEKDENLITKTISDLITDTAHKQKLDSEKRQSAQLKAEKERDRMFLKHLEKVFLK